MTEELKRCPFCGGEALVVLKEAHDKEHNIMDLIVECQGCLVVVWGDFIEDPECEIIGKINQAIETWNMRTPELNLKGHGDSPG